jgi:hypothetical protein
MLTKTAIALAIIVSTASCALAATKQRSNDPNRDAYDGRGVYDGSNPGILINRPHHGTGDRAE